MRRTSARIGMLAASLLAWSVVLGAGCATTSPEIVEGEERAVGGVEVGLVSRVEGAPEGAASPGELACYDAAFLGSPDGPTRPAQIPVPCWRAFITARQRVERDRAAALERLAREREALGAPLIRAEAGACQGLGEGEIGLSPFYFREDIEEIAVMEEGGQVVGARVAFRAEVPNLTAERLEQVVRCHLERARIVCDPDAEAYCPIALGDVAVTVRAEGTRLVVELRGTTEEATGAVLERLHGAVSP